MNPIQSLYSWYSNTLRNPKYRWWLILGTLAYFVFPFDLLPDVFPIVGQIDDTIVVGLLMTAMSEMLVQRLKSRKDAATTEAGTVGEGAAVNSDTVDVKAVPLK